ncbi:phospholipase D-like domain-containing protein [uncultured Methylophaga sp.]|uniref:phospholipase D-like domain-containing protein n=1 Tax=uncultured Methylophaga sp. TaxID=285271 RepID=UPI0030D71B8B|tara:strand:+ start:1803 stop:3266 length:1464 start_codon:yes stop_codon:yes gene_type:complete
MKLFIADRPAHRSRHLGLWILSVLVIVLVGMGFYHVYKPLPPGVDFSGPERSATEVQFLADRTFIKANGERYTDQQIFDAVFDMIAGARQFVLVDMFLFNDFQGQLTETHRPLSDELTDALIAQKKRYPALDIQVISDPLNTLYGGRPSPHFAQLEAADISVTLTDLTRLRDSNPTYSAFWRLFIHPFGNSEGELLPNPFGEGRVSLRSYLAMLNFKANHRKLIIADDGTQLSALVTSANPHDGSSAHGNVALRFNGAAAWDLFESEAAVLKFSDAPVPIPEIEQISESSSNGLTVQVITERSVERASLEMIDGAEPGDKLDMAMFYLSDRDIIKALKRAAERGVSLRVLLDPNKDAFGRKKNGVPNRPVAHELVDAGITVRWCDTHGEQCHAKWLMHRGADEQSTMLLGSTNLTRRNLHNLNLETNVILRGSAEAEPLQRGRDWFEERWNNRDERNYSVDYAQYADERLWPRMLYRIMEATGISTF